MKNKFSIALSLAVILSMLLTSLALADQFNADADAFVLSEPHANSFSATQNGGTTASYPFSAYIKETGNANDNVFPGTVTVAVTRSGAWASGGTNSFDLTAYNLAGGGAIQVGVPCGLEGTSVTMTVSLNPGSGKEGNTVNPDPISLSYVITAGADDPSCAPPPPANTEPSLNLPADMTVEGNTTDGANVSFSVSASDSEDNPDPTPTCSADSGDFFPLGTTTVNCSVTDSGGLSDAGSFTVTVVDTTDPTIGDNLDMVLEATGPDGAVATFSNPTASDIVDSNVAVVCSPDSGSTFPFGHTTVTCTATDDSGNTAQSDFDVLVQDTIVPEILCTVPDQTIWYGDNVTVDCTASDSGSGLADPADATFSLSTNVLSGVETATASTGSKTVSDVSGNDAVAGPYTFMVDRKGPAITITVPSGSYLLNQVVNSNFNCTDGGSGVANCTGAATVDTSAAGPHTFTVTATDNVGNSSSASANYTVNYAVCALYDQTKSHKKGSTVPIKLQLCDANGVNVSSASIVVRAISVTKIDNNASGALEDSGAANSPDMNFRYDATLGGSGGYIFNLSTKSLTTGTWKVNFTVDGSGSYSVQFDVK